MTDLDVWSLVQKGLFKEACSAADIEYQQSKKVYHLRNKVFALFHLKKYDEAKELIMDIIKLENGESENDFKFLGIANWTLGNVTEAIDAWQQAKNCLYKDAAGGLEIQLYLYFTGLKTNQERLRLVAVTAIRKLLKSKRSINWPGPACRFLLNEITENEMFSDIANVPILRERQLCQTDFILAIKALKEDNKEVYYEKLKNCVDHGPNSYLEPMYYLANGELELNTNIR